MRKPLAHTGGDDVSSLVRFSVSLESDLLDQFDRYIQEQRFATRSEAVRQLLRETLTTHGWDTDAEDAAATLTIVYDHHRTSLMEKLLELQHRHAELVVSTMHVHLDHDHCLEVIVLRGRATSLQKMAAELKGLKGIHQGKLVLARTAAHAPDAHHAHHHDHDHE
jgi:CopG family nickel-responsive transcriptional regulator